MEWITVCGVRFWGESQIQEGIWMSRGLGCIFFMSAIVATSFALRTIADHDWMSWVYGMMLFLLALVAAYVGVALFSDASCYASY